MDREWDWGPDVAINPFRAPLLNFLRGVSNPHEAGCPGASALGAVVFSLVVEEISPALRV